MFLPCSFEQRDLQTGSSKSQGKRGSIDEQFGAAKSLADLRRAGFRIVLDDFGTGFSSLSYLTRLQVDKLKIDQSFIKRAREGDNAVAVIRSIVDLGHAIKLSVIAEGVETSAQEAIIRAAGCDQWQGYLFSPPVSMDEIDRLLADRKQWNAA
jgi:EAL domain-containing protein (putative c-di-GMP-specific phosphodiesterase class I)